MPKATKKPNKITKEYLTQEYIENNRSFSSIARELRTHSMTVRRAAIQFGIPLRTKSEAQKLCLSSGARKHPTQGKKLSVATKLKIGRTLHDQWINLDSEEKERINAGRKERWNNMSEEHKQAMYTKAAQSVRRASVEGSKMERFLLSYLREFNFVVEFHKKQLVPNEKLECDFYLPELKTVIEVDGPSHFLPIYGEEALQKTQRADQAKNGLLLSKGYFLIRVKHIKRSATNAYLDIMCHKVIKELYNIEAGRYNEDKRFILIEE